MIDNTLSQYRDAEREFARDYWMKVLESVDFNVYRAARASGVNRTDLYKRLKSLGIPLPHREPGRIRKKMPRSTSRCPACGEYTCYSWIKLLDTIGSRRGRGGNNGIAEKNRAKTRRTKRAEILTKNKIKGLEKIKANVIISPSEQHRLLSPGTGEELNGWDTSKLERSTGSPTKTEGG